MDMDFTGQVWKMGIDFGGGVWKRGIGKLHILVWNKSRVEQTGSTPPTKNTEE